MKKQVAVFFGGRTVEHDVSIITGQQAMDNLDTAKYDVVPVYIARDGAFYTGEKLRDIAFLRSFDARGVKRVTPPSVPGENGLYAMGGWGKPSKVASIDVALLAMHGLHGEDGSLQGLLEMADIPYTSTGVTASGVGMDKIVMKAWFKGLSLPVLESEQVLRDEWRAGSAGILSRLEAALGYPMFVKPANLGSSIGISRADGRDALSAALETASAFDSRIIVERALDAPMELNCAALGFGSGVDVSLVEQPLSWQDFLTFEDKYLTGSKQQGMASLKRRIPAPIDDALTERVRDMSREVFLALGAKGVIRIDYLYDTKQDALYINEINTIPGSFAFYLFEPLGLSFKALLDRLVEGALAAQAEKQRSSFAFHSSLLAQQGGGKAAKMQK